MTLPVTLDDLRSAQARIAPVAHRTPVVTSRTFNDLVDAEVFFKLENLQQVGAFKFRGAYNALSRFTEEQKAAGVVTFSSGNHAQAIARSAKLLGIKAVIVMPRDAPASKLEATRGYGAEIVLYDRYAESRNDLGSDLVARHGYTLIPPYDHPDIVAGQGTAALEMLEETGPLDVVVAPLGGGGLLSGTAIAVNGVMPNASILGVEPAAGNDGQQSFRQGSIVEIPTPKTLADGAQTTSLGALTFTVIRELVDDVLTVDDDALVKMMRFFASRMKLVVEPTGCLAPAALMQKTIDVRGKRVGVIVSGGNVDLDRFADLLRTE
ncbi:threo-3-hydroxy-L-aspartate ammonia-lyase [Saxibacter everestensis]|uniref:Threo-3-hydroxy-L-aspartate ammonia-lyase n=1 Tax=Saxibacter everestensis TaxID=2909229 RepID=A0ABY8QSH6_9MICO|nr:threo-3-hydroxy-L-aspartate ammonia-lyase [Brevibacteriaceae bacterium ZFBP1038]